MIVILLSEKFKKEERAERKTILSLEIQPQGPEVRELNGIDVMIG